MQTQEEIKAALLAEAAEWQGDFKKAAWAALCGVADRLEIELTVEECRAAHDVGLSIEAIAANRLKDFDRSNAIPHAEMKKIVDPCNRK